MRIQSITPVDNNDFFTQFKSFLVGLSSYGWAVDAQNANEIYIHNADGDYYAFRQQEIDGKYSYDNDYLVHATHILMCLSNGGYNSASNFYHQPNSSINTLGYAYNTSFNYFINCLVYQNITEAVFIADEKNLIISAKRTAPESRLFLLITKLEKTFSWNGGNIISSTNAILNTILNETIVLRYGINYVNYWFMQNMSANSALSLYNITPFTFQLLYINYISSYIKMCSLFSLNNSYISAGNYTNENSNLILKIENMSFITNLPYSNLDASVINAIPFVPTRMANIKASRYTGLHAMITPYYFLKNNENKFILSGYVDKIKLVARGNLTHMQRIYYGDREYLILEYYVTDNSIYQLAVDITEEP
jgi:hypothetical protein